MVVVVGVFVGHCGSVGWLWQNLLDGVDGVVLGWPHGAEVLDVPVPVGCCCELLSVGVDGTVTHCCVDGSNCSGAWHSGADCEVVVAFVGVGVGVGDGVGTKTDWQFASEPVGVPGIVSVATGPAETDWPKDTRLLTPLQIGAYGGNGLKVSLCFS